MIAFRDCMQDNGRGLAPDPGQDLLTGTKPAKRLTCARLLHQQDCVMLESCIGGRWPFTLPGSFGSDDKGLQPISQKAYCTAQERRPRLG